MQMISNCPLCEGNSLHILGEEEAQMMQCLNCGYTSTSKFVGDKETNEEYAKLTDDMKKWSKEFNGRIWIPTMLTLPIGMLYPFDDDSGDMKWRFAEMVDIPEEEQKNYPVPGDTGQYYERMYDVENKSFFVLFIHLYFNVIWQMLIFFSVTEFFGFAYKHSTLV